MLVLICGLGQIFFKDAFGDSKNLKGVRIINKL